MIRVVDLEGATSAYDQRKNLWATALLAAFIGGFSGAILAMAILWLFIPWPG